MKSAIEVKVRYQETDQMGVVYHGNSFTWFEIARVQLEDLVFRTGTGEKGVLFTRFTLFL